MECEEIQSNINDLNAEASFFIVNDDKDNEYTISFYSSNNELIFEIKEDDKNYISKNSFDNLKKKQKIFSKYNSLKEIKSLIQKLIVKSDEICNLQKANEKYILSIKGEYGLYFDLIPQEKNIQEIIKQLIIDNQRQNEKITKLEKELLITKKQLNEIKDEMNIFLGEGIYYICSALDNKKCFDIKIGENCWYLVINDFKKSNTQKFKVKMKDEIKHCIMNYYDNKIIEIKGYKNGTKIYISDKITNENNQCWYFIKKKEYIYIKACDDNNNIVIDIPNSLTKNETELNLWGFNGGKNQLWKFIKAE